MKDSTQNLYFLPRNYINFTRKWLNTEIFHGAVSDRLSKITIICEKIPQNHSESPEIGVPLHFQNVKKVSAKILMEII